MKYSMIPISAWFTYRLSFRTAKVIQRNLVSKNHLKQKKRGRRKKEKDDYHHFRYLVAKVFKNLFQSVWWCTALIPKHSEGRGRQIFAFKASIVYIANSGAAKVT